MFLIGVVCCALWITGLATSHTMGGFIHVLLVLGIVALMSRMIRGNNSSRAAELRASAARPGTWGSEK
ncbi:MAG: lmo0937 family membrane protein [Terriglobales bacterium]